jgi:hypothetical protein
MKMEKIINLAAHRVTVIEDNTYFKAEIRKLVTANPIPINIYEMDGMLSTEQNWIPDKPICGVKTWRMDPILSEHNPKEDEYYIVSLQYLNALKDAGRDTSHYLTIAKQVFDEDGKVVVGCLGLVRN